MLSTPRADRPRYGVSTSLIGALYLPTERRSPPRCVLGRHLSRDLLYCSNNLHFGRCLVELILLMLLLQETSRWVWEAFRSGRAGVEPGSSPAGVFF